MTFLGTNLKLSRDRRAIALKKYSSVKNSVIVAAAYLMHSALICKNCVI